MCVCVCYIYGNIYIYIHVVPLMIMAAAFLARLEQPKWSTLTLVSCQAGHPLFQQGVGHGGGRVPTQGTPLTLTGVAIAPVSGLRFALIASTALAFLAFLCSLVQCRPNHLCSLQSTTPEEFEHLIFLNLTSCN